MDAVQFSLRDIKPPLLRQALTHPSTEEESNNQRLEFLGDAVLSLVITDWLYGHEEGFAEGKMSQIRAAVVKEETLAAVARKLGLGEIVRLGKGEEKTGGRTRASLLADALEAVIAAYYLSAGWEQTRAAVLALFVPYLQKVCSASFIGDYKSQVQEKFQAAGLNDIKYTVIKDCGPDHDKTFWVQLSVGGKALATGTGKTKKQAEQDAARKALAIDFENRPC